jgi:hypothetical protein
MMVATVVAAEVSRLWPSIVPEVIPNFYCQTAMECVASRSIVAMAQRTVDSWFSL